MNVVVSQSMYFPWVGMLEQIRLADRFVHYDDVQFARGFLNRVQIKTQYGPKWMTVPLSDQHRGQLINEVRIDNSKDWKDEHRSMLKHAYKSTDFFSEMMTVVEGVFNSTTDTLADLSRHSMRSLAAYFSIDENCSFATSEGLGVGSSSSKRLLEIVLIAGGDKYITGHGALKYLDHAMFERAGVTVEYMDYCCVPYPQLHGPFTPYVSSLDLVANCGTSGRSVITSSTTHWEKLVGKP